MMSPMLSLREPAPDSRPRKWYVSAIVDSLWPLLLHCVQRCGGFLLAGLWTLLPDDQGRTGVHPQQSRGGVHQELKLLQKPQHLDRPHQGQPLWVKKRTEARWFQCFSKDLLRPEASENKLHRYVNQPFWCWNVVRVFDFLVGWAWTDKTSLGFLNWAPGQPNAAFHPDEMFEENCVEMLEDGTWNDNICLQKRGFACRHRQCKDFFF